DKGADFSTLSKFLASEGVLMQPLFGLSEERLKAQTSSLATASDSPEINLSTYYMIEAPDDRLDQLAERLRQLEVIDGAYVKPPAMPAGHIPSYLIPLKVVPTEAEPPAVTPDFTPRQGYLDAAPGGIDARYAWTQPGGRGVGVNIIDIEGGWLFSHEDLLQNQGGMVGSGVSGDMGWVNHGTAVVGVISGDVNTFGITGICPEANVRGISIYDSPTKQNSPRAIREAADRLGAGDIILIELQRSFRAIEWWPDEFDAIRYAVNKGIIVVEAAGNGNHNLDDPKFNTPEPGFPSTWKNPYNPANPSSGAVMAGAGNPPAGTHGRNRHESPYPEPSWEPYVDRARCWFSNYGARVDAQGWGWEVTSTGYGDYQGGSNKNLWYTDYFSGTSSASPVVVGALGCLQGVLRTKGNPLLTPAKARELLRTTGSPQQDGPGFTFPNGSVFPARPSTQLIGNRPNLRQLISAVVSGWQYNKTVIRTHAKNNTQMAWAIIDGGGWLRVKPISIDGVSNIFMILCEALANNRKVDVFIEDGQIAQATLK
ncbi:MAG: S8 family peptidase, partial [Desulfobacterales bacterium]